MRFHRSNAWPSRACNSAHSHHLGNYSDVNKARGGSTLGRGDTCPPNSLVAPQIRKLADHSDVIYEVQKCSKIQIFKLRELTRPLADEEGARCPYAKNPTPGLGPLGLVSTGLRVQPITELASLY